MQTSFHVHSTRCGCSPEARAVGETDSRPRVVIVGAGFGGLSTAKALSRANIRVTLADRRNHHLFQPLLYQVATAGLSPGQIATPIRTILRKQKNAEVLLGTVTGVDTVQRHVALSGGQRINYDYLVLATGARHSYFGRDEWEQFAPGLKSLEDATELRKRILLAFERAELEEDWEARRRLLTFVVIGAGPTGVEMAGSIAELAHRALASDFRAIDPHAARVVLVEAGPRALSTFPEDLSAYTEKALGRLRVELMMNTRVTDIDADGVTISTADGSQKLRSACVVWAAGVAASPAARWLGVEADRAGRVPVKADLTVEGHPEIFVVGDCALAKDKHGKPLPGLAPVAKQQGEYVGRVLTSLTLSPQKQRPPFRYQDFGALATVGRKIAIADFGKIKLKGFIGWLTWSVAHIYFLIGFRNRFSVALDWTWSYLTFERGARLITGPIDQGRQRKEDGAAKQHAA